MITETLLPAALAFIMFAMGLTLTPGDFRLVAARPRAVAVGLAGKMVLLPLLGAAICWMWPMRPEFAVGLMILAACPGGITSNLLTHLAGGATALAVTLTAITSLTDTVMVPLVVNAALVTFGGYAHGVALPIERMSLAVFAVATLPLLLAMTLRHLRPALTARIERGVRPLATVVFVAIVIGAFASQWTTMMSHAAEVMPPALALNAGAMAIAALTARGFGLTRREHIAVVLETGLQNGAVGIFVAATLLGSPAMMVPSIVYALLMNVTALAFIAVVRARGEATA